MDEHDTEAQLRTLLQETPEQGLWSEEAVADIMAAGTRGRRRRAVVAWAASAAAFALVVAGGTVAWQLRPDASMDGSMLSVGADATRSPEVAVADVFPEASELGGALSYEGDPAGLPGTTVAPVTGGQACDPTVIDASGGVVLPVSQEQLWATLWGSTATTPDSATFTVSTWADERGWAQLVADTGTCRWLPHTPASWPGGYGTDRLLLILDPRSGDQDYSWAVAARKVGPVIVAVVFGSGNADRARSEAVRLCDVMAVRAAAQVLPPDRPTPTWSEGS